MGTSARGPGMGEMVQMITSLGQLQESRKRRMQDASQHKDQIASMAARLGFEKGSERWQQVTKAIEMLTTAPTETREAIGTILQAGGFPQEMGPMIAELVAKAPETASNFQNRQVQAGFGNMTPEQQRQAQIAAATASTSGQTPLGMQASQPVGPGKILEMVQGGVQNQTGKPLQTALEGSILGNPTLVQQMAGIQAGNMSPGQEVAAANDAARLASENYTRAQQMGLQIALAGAKNPADPGILSAVSELGRITDQIFGKNKQTQLSNTGRDVAVQRYNYLVEYLKNHGGTGLTPLIPSQAPK